MHMQVITFPHAHVHLSSEGVSVRRGGGLFIIVYSIDENVVRFETRMVFCYESVIRGLDAQTTEGFTDWFLRLSVDWGTWWYLLATCLSL